MGLQELVAVVPAPLAPKNTGSLQEWEAVEKTLGTALPSDFRDFCMRYGSGVFNDPGRLAITVRNPLAREFQEQFRTDCEFLQGIKAELTELGDEHFPYAVFPESPGLLLWGEDDNGNTLYWLTDGAPGNWPLVLWPHGYSFEHVDMSMTSFLAGEFSREIKCSFWGEPFFSGPRRVKFVSTGDKIEYA
jgi:SMI1-KNR4 cell-wall